MSKWAHVMCRTCWDKKHPGREPHAVVNAQVVSDLCCFCGEPAGEPLIWVRQNPGTVACLGVAGVHTHG